MAITLVEGARAAQARRAIGSLLASAIARHVVRRGFCGTRHTCILPRDRSDPLRVESPAPGVTRGVLGRHRSLSRRERF